MGLTDFGPRCDSYSGLWTESSSSWIQFQGSPENTILDNHPRKIEPLRKSDSSGREKEFGCTGEDQKSWSLLHITFPPGQHSSLPDTFFSSHDFSWEGKYTACEGTPSFPSCAGCSQESSCLPTHPESWVMSWMTGGWEQAGRGADNTFGGIEKGL